MIKTNSTVLQYLIKQIISYSKRDETAPLANQLLLASELIYMISHKDIVSSVNN